MLAAFDSRFHYFSRAPCRHFHFLPPFATIDAIIDKHAAIILITLLPMILRHAAAILRH